MEMFENCDDIYCRSAMGIVASLCISIVVLTDVERPAISYPERRLLQKKCNGERGTIRHTFLVILETTRGPLASLASIEMILQMSISIPVLQHSTKVTDLIEA